MKKKSYLEKVLTPKQMKWVVDNKNHNKVIGLNIKINEIMSYGHQKLGWCGMYSPTKTERIEDCKKEILKFKSWLDKETLNY